MAKLSKTEAAIEAILFALGASVEIRQLCIALEMKEDEVIQNLESLKEKYEKDNRGIQIIDLGDCVQMCTKSEHYEKLIKVCKTPKKQVLTDAMLETLSIIAYKQPITKSEIEKIRGVSSDHMVNRLVEFGLVYEAGKLDAPGRPAQFATTEEFLRRFGVESKEALPRLDSDLEAEILHEVEEETGWKFGFESEINGTGGDK
ncbi:SMC-Scp complex subunit ScpB [Lachnoanaerobaculum umeaense]|jgi:segregation and condensation protein B|uniref:SMC-Scp complex subunit ScpB n=1 Tax=Lachnoanaerobaculum umeaense TaxID=617123 RepID=A0A385Q469_9FIRM|nr:SMC-Scp complex subunit ScpB [Lachnoanaerobaculum umeaense]AYB00508.1 SMC-Scp complex subunit ScpB [Lachnoanaerobaculum umeaense]PZW98558.1 segregation and condensation protein B [Lachnoanaerobaculum umeaense]